MVNIPIKQFLSYANTITSFEYITELLPKCTASGPWIAGGYIHRTYKKLPVDNSDIDVFFSTEKQQQEYVESILKLQRENKIEIVSQTKNHWHDTFVIKYCNILWKIQCINFIYFQSIENLFESFDINVCKVAYDGTNIVCVDDWMNKVDNNILELSKKSINYPNVTLKRLVKYMQMGYTVSDENVNILCDAFKVSIKKNKIDDLDKNLKPDSRNNYSYQNLN